MSNCGGDRLPRSVVSTGQDEASVGSSLEHLLANNAKQVKHRYEFLFLVFMRLFQNLNRDAY